MARRRRLTCLLGRLGGVALRKAPPALLVAAARAAAPSTTLALEPGWSFAVTERTTGGRASVRRALWTTFRDRSIDRPVSVHWYDDLRVHLYLGNDLSLCVYVAGSFEPNEFLLLSKVLERGMVVVDGGANEGLYSLFAARRVAPTGSVLAIEPSSREYARLLDNFRLNDVGNATALRVALGASRGTATLAIAAQGHEGLNTVGQRVSTPQVETTAHEVVELWSLDDLVEHSGLERVDVIKLDVEGSEVRTLEGARAVVERYRPLVLLEAEVERLASQASTKDDLLDTVAALGYELYVFDEVTGQLRPWAPSDEPAGNVVAAPRGWTPPIL